jgi:RNA polymerase sigma-70 factor (ECF subfamily)
MPALHAPLAFTAASDVSDLVAVASVIGGQREMFEVIVRRYNAQLYRVGMAYLHDHAQTEDAMQNAYLKAFLRLDRFAGTSKFSTWLTRIMINECLMFLRSKKSQHLEPLDQDDFHEPEALTVPAADPLRAEELKAVLEDALGFLPRQHRAVYLLRDVQQLSTHETAECLGISPENVKVCLHRARDGLKAQLMKSAAGLELFDYPAQFCDPMTAKVMAAIRALPAAEN